MYEQLLSRSERCIEQQHDHQLTVSSLWEKVKGIAAKEHFVIPDTMSDFECLLEGDKRFWFGDARQSEDAPEDGGIIDREFSDIDEIEGLGFDREQTVTLTRFIRRVETDDEDEDESFAPRPFKKDEEPTDGIALITPKKSTSPRPKKTAQKKSSTKRK